MPYPPPQRITSRSRPETLVSPDEKGGIHGSKSDLRRSFVAPGALSRSHMIQKTGSKNSQWRGNGADEVDQIVIPLSPKEV